MGGSAALLRRELRGRGCVGDPSQKDKSRYNSVKHQISELRNQSYAGSEIINSIIRTMHSSSRLKCILEMKQNFDMPTLLDDLQHCCKEKSTPDICANLTAATKMQNETPVDFDLRCIELREKLLFSSKTPGEIEYDAHLVQKLFLRTLERGSESVHVLQEVRPVLRHPDTCDEQILSVTQRASVDERKRSKLFSRKAPKVQLFQRNHSISCSPGAQQNDHEFAPNRYGKLFSEFTSAITKVKGRLRPIFCIDINTHSDSDRKWKM